MTNSADQNLNKREPQFNVPKKTVPVRNMKKPRKYFDSADWMLAGKEYQPYPVKAPSKKEEEHAKQQAIHIEEELREEEMAASVEHESQLQIEAPSHSVVEQHEEDSDEDKENRDTQLKGSSPVQHSHSHHPQKGKQERKYFDSADWVLEKKIVPNKTYRNFPQPDPKAVLTKKKLEKSRQFFDSADWALQHGKYVPQMYPKLPVLQK